MEELFDYPYPEELFDKDGYPTDEALNYINNWGYKEKEDGSGLVFGKYTSSGNYQELVDFVKALWCYGENAYEQKDGLFELHTLGWSGNESIIRELKNTIFWTMKWRVTSVGGHYYFRMDNNSELDWDVIKNIDPWKEITKETDQSEGYE